MGFRETGSGSIPLGTNHIFEGGKLGQFGFVDGVSVFEERHGDDGLVVVGITLVSMRNPGEAAAEWLAWAKERFGLPTDSVSRQGLGKVKQWRDGHIVVCFVEQEKATQLQFFDERLAPQIANLQDIASQW